MGCYYLLLLSKSPTLVGIRLKSKPLLQKMLQRVFYRKIILYTEQYCRRKAETKINLLSKLCRLSILLNKAQSNGKFGTLKYCMKVAVLNLKLSILLQYGANLTITTSMLGLNRYRCEAANMVMNEVKNTSQILSFTVGSRSSINIISLNS